MTERKTQVLVVGAGPVGLFAALCAARSGFSVEILDESATVQSRGHASLLHASSLRMLEKLDLKEQVLARGHRVERTAIYVDGARSAASDLRTPALALPQSALEDALRTALRAEGIEVITGRQATMILERDDRVQVRVMQWELAPAEDDRREKIWQPVSSSIHETDFVIGADGRSSRVRSALGIDSLEIGHPTSYAMFEMPSKDPGSEMVLAFSDGLASAMVPLPGGRVRWGFQVESRASEKLYASDLAALLAKRAPWYEGGSDRIEWGSVVRFESRIARRFGRGRAWLAGDAAHGTSPLGAQSMNVGLLEALELVRAISRCQDAGGPVEVLEQYGSESHREWQKLLGLNVGFELLPHAPSWLAALARRIVPTLPSSGLEIEPLLTRLGLALR